MFDAHGKYDFEIRGEIVFIRLYQSWNLECSKHFFAAYKQLILEQKFEKYGVLADFSKLEGATLDAIDYFQDISRWALGQGQVARAQCIDSRLNQYIADIPTKDFKGFPIKNFENEDLALEWLRDQGLSIE